MWVCRRYASIMGKFCKTTPFLAWGWGYRGLTYPLSSHAWEISATEESERWYFSQADCSWGWICLEVVRFFLICARKNVARRCQPQLYVFFLLFREQSCQRDGRHKSGMLFVFVTEGSSFVSTSCAFLWNKRWKFRVSFLQKITMEK